MAKKGTTENRDRTKECWATVSGGSGDDLADENLPNSLKAILDMWNAEQSRETGKKLVDDLSKHLRATFAPINCSTAGEILTSLDDIAAHSVQITGFDFDGTTNLPSVDAVAIFLLPFSKLMTAAQLEEWEFSHDDGFAWCVTFHWEFDDYVDAEWNGSLEDNSGIEFGMVE